MFNICKKQSKLELAACFAVGTMVGVMGCAMMSGTKTMRQMRKKACHAAHCVSDFVVDNVKSML